MNFNRKLKECQYAYMKCMYEVAYAVCISSTSPIAICWKSSMRILGITLVIFFYALVAIILYSYFFDTCKIYYLVYRNSYLATAMISLGLFLSYCILHNFTLAALVGPGDTKYFKEYTEEDYENLKKRLDNNNLNYCKKCQTFKPDRAHHCSICEKCVLKMDHHCPWVNNCVGHNNHRYFLLMILYLQISLFILLILNIPLIFSESFLAHKMERTGFFVFIATLTISLIIVLFFFNLWNWYLAFIGYTTIEYWGGKNDARNPQASERKNFQSPNHLDNLYQIFGQRSFCKIMAPTFKKMHHDGVKWSVNTADLEKGCESETLNMNTSN